MKDQLQEFILNSDFDIMKPHSGHEDRFLRILNKESKKKKSISRKWLMVAASVIFLISFYLGKNSGSNYSMNDIFPEMAETQQFFVSTINQELKEIEKYRNIETEVVIENTLDQIEELEDQFFDFKKDFIYIGNEKQIIQGMIDNYQQRLQILENLLSQLKSIKTPVKQNFDEFI